MHRRDYLMGSGGIGSIALASLLADSARSEDSTTGKQGAGMSSLALGNSTPGTVKVLHYPAKAKRVVQLFMAGAASPLDLFDHKPALEKHHGEASDFGEHVEAFQNGLGPWMKSPFRFRPYGESGKMLSDAVEPLSACADKMTFIHNVVGQTGVHSQATFLQATGFQRPGFPGVGAWVSYAMGSMNDNLPTFVVLPDHRGFASNGPKNWHSSFLPAQHQGTVMRPGAEDPIADLVPRGGKYITAESERRSQALLKLLNEKHRDSRPGDDRLTARIRSYELAASMQLAAPEALDMNREPKHILKLYGLDHGRSTFNDEINEVEESEYFGRKCLAARRLLERGVRFVQIWSGNDNGFPRRNWDSHEDIKRDHWPLARGMARGAAGLIQDMDQRGMLDDTLVLWTTEFGRMPSTQGSKGRDHNPYVFSNWFCGGGIQGGLTHGLSDQWGYKPLDRDHPTHVWDIHATMLRLLGIDHTKVAVKHDGIARRLTDVHGHVIKEII